MRGNAGPLAGIPIALQGPLRHARHPDHGRLGAARRLGARSRLDLREPAPASRDGDARQAHHPRVRVRHPVPRAPLPARAQPVEPRSHSRRLLERLGRSARGRAHRGRSRLRHGRLHPRTGGVLRHRRPQAHLRPRQPRRRADPLLDARPHRPHGEDRRRLRAHAAGAGRLRLRRSCFEPRARAGLRGDAPSGRQRPQASASLATTSSTTSSPRWPTRSSPPWGRCAGSAPRSAT